MHASNTKLRTFQCNSIVFLFQIRQMWASEAKLLVTKATKFYVPLELPFRRLSDVGLSPDQ
jgi:hypothetical protein